MLALLQTECYILHMDRRTPATTVAEAVADTMTTRHVSEATLSQATGIEPVTLREHLSNVSEFTFGELTDVGGFFRLPVSHFLEGITA